VKTYRGSVSLLCRSVRERGAQASSASAFEERLSQGSEAAGACQGQERESRGGLRRMRRSGREIVRMVQGLG
jgi:hypothetical protein